MNSDFERDGYKIVKNFITKDSADILCALTLKTIFDPLLSLLTPKINESLELDLIPTYYLQTTYLKGGSLPSHTDRHEGS